MKIMDHLRRLLTLVQVIILPFCYAAFGRIDHSQRQTCMANTKVPWNCGTKLCVTTKPFSSERERRLIQLSGSGKNAYLLSRNIPISPGWTITVWEWEQPASIVESYWEAQARTNQLALDRGRLLDPFGLVSWPGSVVAAQALQLESSTVRNHSVLILGAGVGVEAQAVAELGAREVLATDIHPTTLQQLQLGIMENDRIKNKEVVHTQIFDLMSDEPIPMPYADLIVVADVLYNEQLAKHVTRRLAEGWQNNPMVKILITDSQRFVDISNELSHSFHTKEGDNVPSPFINITEQNLVEFTGSGVCIDDDQTYDVKVRKIWIGLV